MTDHTEQEGYNPEARRLDAEMYADLLDNVTFARHGKTPLNEIGQLQGSTNSSLSEGGRQEVEHLSDELAGNGRDYTLVVTSPMNRARESAEIYAARLGHGSADIVVVPDLQEFNFGDWEGRQVKDLQQFQPHNDWIAHPYLRSVDAGSPPNGESIEAFLIRVNQGMQRVHEQLKAKGPGAKALVVSHAMVSRAIRFDAKMAMSGVREIGPTALKADDHSIFHTGEEKFIKIPHAAFHIDAKTFDLK